MRRKIVQSVDDEGLTVFATAKSFGFPHSIVRGIYNTFMATGRTSKLPRGENRRRLLEEQHIEWLRSRIDQRVDMTIGDLHCELNEHFALDPPVSKTSVHRAITDMLGYTLKLIRREPDRYNDPPHIATRQAWAETLLEDHGNMNSFV